LAPIMHVFSSTSASGLFMHSKIALLGNELL